MEYSELMPQEVFKYFREISEIPHGSGNTKKITNYCIGFANKHKLKSYSDDAGNVVIYKDGTLKNRPPVILQGHLDMVCEKDPDCAIDMEKDSLNIMTDGEYVWADGTTLGGDDGIAVAYMLALLAADDIEHPPIEALFTVDEETGMTGAKALDASVLSGKRLINIDSEEEGILTVSCAGGVRAYTSFPVKYDDIKEFDTAYHITIGGLPGGHSGMDIIKFKKNAIVLLGEILNCINSKFKIGIAELRGGGKDNVIACIASCTVCLNCKNEEELKYTIDKYISETKKEIGVDTLYASIEKCDKKKTADSTEKIIFYLVNSPDGVYSMNPDVSDMVQTSLNMGIVSLSENGFDAVHLIRSNSDWGKNEISEKLKLFVSFIGGHINFDSDYPAWEYKKESPLREVMKETYKKFYGSEPEVMSIHAGLECGILADKIDGVDMVSFGPTLENIHTTQEKMSVESVNRSWEYLKLVLKKL